MKERYTQFAGYNAWANRRIYDVAATLSDEEYRADKGAFFKSMHGTLNHLLVTDWIWMKRFTGEGDAPSRLDAIVHERFDALRQARESEDRRIAAFIDSLDETRLAGALRYRRVSTPDEVVQPLMSALDHWFNHQTHHRGQAHTILSSLGKPAPELDLLAFQRLRAAGKA
jgi:uncharacterized damage-inducible protein DinB